MRTAQTMGVDLPLRALVWQDEAGTTQLSFNDPSRLAERHGAEGSNQAVLRAMADFLATVSREAANRAAHMRGAKPLGVVEHACRQTIDAERVLFTAIGFEPVFALGAGPIVQ